MVGTYDPTLRLRRILCLHGGGTNAGIFRMQCRKIAEDLKGEFRLVYVEAPFPSEAGPDVMTVFANDGPFKRWLRFGPMHPEITPEAAVAKLDQAIEAAMADDDEAGGSGEWTALLGFSQGAKICASLLYRQQCQVADDQRDPMPKFRFGVLMAGRGPPVSLEPDRSQNETLPTAAQFSSTVEKEPRGNHILTIPTIHMHGLKDPGIESHRKLYEEYCTPESRTLITWDAGHRLPIRPDDVTPLVTEIRRVARATATSRK